MDKDNNLKDGKLNKNDKTNSSRSGRLDFADELDTTTDRVRRRNP